MYRMEYFLVMISAVIACSRNSAEQEQGDTKSRGSCNLLGEGDVEGPKKKHQA